MELHDKYISEDEWLLPWDLHMSENFLEDGQLCFTCVYADPYVEDEESVMKKIYEELLKYELQVWIDNYIWAGSKPRIYLKNAKRRTYIVGLFDCGSSDDDEWLICSLLTSFSTRYENLYIHISDADGEFLLAEFHEVIPSFLTTKCGFNRPWINNGQLVVIPLSGAHEGNLTLKQSISFLDSFSFKLIKDPNVNKAFSEKMQQYPRRSLSLIFMVDALVPTSVAGQILGNQKSLASQAICAALSSETQKFESIAETIKVSIPVSAFCYLLLKSENKLDDEVGIGRLIAYGVESLFEKYDIRHISDISESAIKHFESDQLQLELKKLNKISSAVSPDHSLLPDLKNGDEQKMFETYSSILENISQDATTQAASQDEEKTQYETEDQRIREYFKSENVDIDEDDFFEFVLREGLKMKAEDIENYRRQSDEETYNDDSDYSSEAEDESEEQQQIKTSIENLAKSLRHGRI